MPVASDQDGEGNLGGVGVRQSLAADLGERDAWSRCDELEARGRRGALPINR